MKNLRNECNVKTIASSFYPIGVIRSCFKQKFGIPRQPGLIPEAQATLEIYPPFDCDEAIRGLEQFSHVWLIFLFHAQPPGAWHPTVRPPRLGGNRRVGVFASRSPFRPNPLGLSAVRLLDIARVNGCLTLSLGGVDMLDCTPVLDIKPYIPYADAISDAIGGFADHRVNLVTVNYAPEAADFLAKMYPVDAKQLMGLIEGMLAQDPQPAYMDATEAQRQFGMLILDYNVRWYRTAIAATVTTITTLK